MSIKRSSNTYRHAVSSIVGSFFAALLLLGLFAVPALGQEQDCNSCVPCHGNLEDVHGDFNHAAAPGTGPVVLFGDRAHDDAGWTGQKPYFAVAVDCLACHTKDLPAAHGGDCATCHPTPYDTLGLWNKGCQQGGCHSFIHTDSIEAHLPFEDAYDSSNDCLRCHKEIGWDVTTNKCLNCHATYGPDDISPPTTTTDALAEYIGPARIDFSLTDNGKVAVGRTFYRLDGGPTTAAGKKVFVPGVGSHHLEFWSMDQSGNVEQAPNNVYFNVNADTTAPVTTSNALATHNEDDVITLSATDNGTLGVKTTFYRLDGSAVQSGKLVTVPSTGGEHTLDFWSEDWSGNIEAENSATFTVNAGPGILRLVWFDSDSPNPQYPPDELSYAEWTVRVGGPSGRIVSQGYGNGNYGWDGIEDIPLDITQTYYVKTFWEYDGYSNENVYPNIQFTVGGEVIRREF